jgi:hypothetical protein
MGNSNISKVLGSGDGEGTFIIKESKIWSCGDSRHRLIFGPQARCGPYSLFRIVEALSEGEQNHKISIPQCAILLKGRWSNLKVADALAAAAVVSKSRFDFLVLKSQELKQLAPRT